MDFSLFGVQPQPAKRDEKHVKVLILGTGPAGLTAALYAARANLDPIVLSGMEHGGQVSVTYLVENYPGFPDGMSGGGLVDLFQKHALRFGARIEYDIAEKADLSQRPFRIETYNTTYLAESLIITTGATPRHLDVPGERELTGKGVSYCATCDGWFFKNKDVIVVGGGDSAVEEAIFLTRFANSVTIVHRRDKLRAGAVLQSRAFEHPKIKFIWNSMVTEIVGEDSVQGVILKDVQTDVISEISTNGIFVFIGRTPNTQLFADQISMDPAGYIITDTSMHTNIPGVFAAGEAADSVYRQVITSAGMGAAAAIQANRFLDEIENKK